MKRKKFKTLQEGEGKRKSGAIIGIDAHSSVLACCIIDDETILFEKNLANTKSGIQNLLKILSKYKVKSTAFESTSIYHVKLMFALLEKNHPLLLANPLQTRTTQGKKTDKLDAKRIAVAHRDGRLKPSIISPKPLMQLRRSLRSMVRLTEDQTKCKQRLNQLFHQYDFTVHQQIKHLLQAQWSLKLMRECVSLNISSNTKTNLHKMIFELVEINYPRVKIKRKLKDHQRVELLIQSLTDLMNQLQTAPMDRYSFITEFSQMQLLELLIQQQRQIYLQYANEHPDFALNMKILLGVPGIGPDSAAILLSEIVDIKYFDSPSKLVKWAGLAPKVYQSGHRKRVTGKLHKGGNKHIRRILGLIGKNIYARADASNPLYAFIKNKYLETDKYWLSICAGARKLLCIIWTILTHNQAWRVSSLDKTALEQVHKLIVRKIKAHEGGIRRLEDTQEKLNWAINHQLNLNFGGAKHPKKALRILLNAM